MRLSSRAAVVSAAAMILFAPWLAAQAAEVKLIGANPMKTAIQDLAAQFTAPGAVAISKAKGLEPGALR